MTEEEIRLKNLKIAPATERSFVHNSSKGITTVGLGEDKAFSWDRYYARREIPIKGTDGIFFVAEIPQTIADSNGNGIEYASRTISVDAGRLSVEKVIDNGDAQTVIFQRGYSLKMWKIDTYQVEGPRNGAFASKPNGAGKFYAAVLGQTLHAPNGERLYRGYSHLVIPSQPPSFSVDRKELFPSSPYLGYPDQNRPLRVESNFGR